MICSFGAFLKDRVYVLLQPNHLPYLRHRREKDIASITSDLLTELGSELDFRLNECRITKCAYFEHL